VSRIFLSGLFLLSFCFGLDTLSTDFFSITFLEVDSVDFKCFDH